MVGWIRHSPALQWSHQRDPQRWRQSCLLECRTTSTRHSPEAFWSEKPLRYGAALEFDMEPAGFDEEGPGTTVCIVKDFKEDRHGMRVDVLWLGSVSTWAQQLAVKLFSRGKRSIHICRSGKKGCGSKDSKLVHIDTFGVAPPGVRPPRYVGRAKVKAWQQMNDERVKGLAAGRNPGGGAAPKEVDPKEAPDRVALLRSKLLKKGPPAAPKEGKPPVADAATLAMGDRPAKEKRPSKKKGVGEALVAVAAKRRKEDEKKKSKTDGSPPGGGSGGGGSSGSSSSSTSSKKKKGKKTSKKDPKKKKKKEKKKRKKRSRSGSSGGDSDSSSSSSMLPPLQRKAQKRPGSVLEISYISGI